jgi:hypothetical protein
MKHLTRGVFFVYCNCKTTIMSRQLVNIRKAFNYFDKNKTWILSTLFIFSIIRDCVWYACFGINILSYSSVQDAFISFFNFMTIFIVIPIVFILASWFPSKSGLSKFGKRFSLVIGILIFCVLLVIYFNLFKKTMSLLTILALVILLTDSFIRKDYLAAINIIFLVFIVMSMIEPLIQYNYILNEINQKEAGSNFTLTESNTEILSFCYKDVLYNTKDDRYFLIGNTSNYIYLFDNKEDKSLIFPKSECEDIKAEVFVLYDLNKR